MKFNASPTARKYRKCRSSIAEIHYAEMAGLRKEGGFGRYQPYAVVRYSYTGRNRQLRCLPRESRRLTRLVRREGLTAGVEP